MTRERTLASRRVFDGFALGLRVDTIETADGGEATREIIEHADAVAVVAVDGEDNVLLVRQYRKAVERELLEVVAGGIDPGESPEQAVLREMQEETGYVPGKVERLGGFYSAPGFLTEYLHLYLATELTPSRLHAEDTDGISVVRVPVSEIAALLASDRMEDVKSVAGLHTYLARRKSLGDA